MNYEVPLESRLDPIWERLEDQIRWHDLKAAMCSRRYKGFKTLEILFAATIPVLSAVNISLGHPNPVGHLLSWIILCLGALITIIEGLIKLNSYQENWISYRATCENLKREKYTYLAKAAQYRDMPDPHTFLAERIEAIISRSLETAQWASIQQQSVSSRAQNKRAIDSP
jgi:hypothetical protein